MSVRKLFDQAQGHHRAGRIGKARKTYLTLLKTAPEHEEANYYLGLLEQKAGEFDSAADRFKSALDRNPEEGTYWLAYIETLLALGDRKAVQVFKQALQRGLQGEAAARLADKIRETFTRLEKPLQLVNYRVLPGMRYGLRQPIVEAQMRAEINPEIDPAELKSRMEDWLDSAIYMDEAKATSLPRLAAQLVLTGTVLLQQKSGHPILSEGLLFESSATDFLLAVPYDDHESAVRALIWMVAALNGLLTGPDLSVPNSMKQQLQELLELLNNTADQSGSMSAFFKAAERRSIPWVRPVDAYYQFGYGARARCLNGTFTDRTSVIGANIARNKNLALQMLKQAGLPVPIHIPVKSLDEALKAADSLGYPVVVKPVDLDGGIGVASGIKTAESLEQAYASACQHSLNIAVEQHILGEDFRLTIVGGKLFQVTHRRPGGVNGDGVSSVAELIDQANRDPRRGTQKSSWLKVMNSDQEALDLLQEQGLMVESIPENGRFVRLRRTANIARGGTPENVLAKIHPDNRLLAQRAAAALGLDIAGIDLLIPDIAEPWHVTGGVICEINSQPNLGHSRPEIYDDTLDWLMAGSDGRIPIAAIISAECTPTIARMLNAILLQKGLCSGVSCAQGVWLGQENQLYWDWSGYQGGRYLLTERRTEAAVIDITTRDIAQQGFPYDFCDVAALLNLPADAVNFDCELQRVRRSVVVNADDPACLAQASGRDPSALILVAQDAANPQLQAHLTLGHAGAWLEEEGAGFLLKLGTREQAETIINTESFPSAPGVALAGAAFNTLFACALAYGLDCAPEVIRQGLLSFIAGITRR